MLSAQVLISQYQIYTSKQLVTTAKSLDVTDSIRLTYQAIAQSCDFTNKTYTSKVSLSRISERVGLSVRQIQRHIVALNKLNVFTVHHDGYICKKSGQRRQSANKYRFNIGVIKGYCHQLKAKCLPDMSKVVPTTKPSQINIDLDFVDDKEKAKEQLSTLTVFQNLKDAWENRGRRYLDRKSGALFIHSSHVKDPFKMIGYVKNSIAHQFVKNVLTGNTEIQKETVKIDYQHFTYATSTHQYCVKGLFFLNKESLLAIIERNKAWS